GRLIQAAVSRQREGLADAAAVQFTRNPVGLAGALKKIGGLRYGSRIESPHAEEASHLFFANGLGNSIFSTHPSLTERIRALDPSFDGKFPRVIEEAPSGVSAAPLVSATPEISPAQARPRESGLKFKSCRCRPKFLRLTSRCQPCAAFLPSNFSSSAQRLKPSRRATTKLICSHTCCKKSWPGISIHISSPNDGRSRNS